MVSEPGMSDPCLERLESEVGSLRKEMQELIKGMSTLKESLLEKKSHEDTSSSKYGKNKGVCGSSHGSVNAKVARLEFPRYDGTKDPTSWICRVNQYFEFQNTKEENKVMLTTYHLEG
jgi:hypothetical protein